MKITGVDILEADGGWRVLSFLKLTTDEGLVGWSEFYDGFGVGGAANLIRRFIPHVLGQDPRAVGPLSGMLHARSRLSPGGVVHQAIAAIENACLDIKAKAQGVPVYALFGGPYRTRIPLYWTHCGYFRALRPALFEGQFGMAGVRSLDDVKALGAEVAAKGFRALKTNPMHFAGAAPAAFNPGFNPDPAAITRNPPPNLIGATRDLLTAFREGAGPNVELLLDLNFTLRPEGYRRVARELEDLKLLWVEIDHPDAAALADIRSAIPMPLASLETIYGAHEYQPFLRRGAVDVAIIDVIWNGLLESVRIAALADAFDVSVAPHNFYGDLGSAIGAHLCAAVPNVRVMEFEVDDAPWRHDFVTRPLTVDNGEIVLGSEPGWGMEVNEEAVLARPAKH